MTKIKSLKVYAIVNKYNPRIRFINIYPDKNVKVHSNETLYELDLSVGKKVKSKLV